MCREQKLLIIPATRSGPGTAIAKTLSKLETKSIAAIQRDADPAVELAILAWDYPRQGDYVEIYDDLATTARLAVSFRTEMTPTGITAGDFDGDGLPDMAVAMRKPGVSVLYAYFGTANGTFEPPVALPSIHPYRLTAGNLDQDGRPDIVASNWDYVTASDLAATTASVYLNRGGRNFLRTDVPLVRLGPEGVTTPIILDDLTGDGTLDLMARQLRGGVVIAAGASDGTFLTPTFEKLSGGAAATGDFDGDGKAELAIEHFRYNPNGGSRDIYVLTNTCGTQVAFDVPPTVPYSQSGSVTGHQVAIAAGQTATMRVRVSGFGSGLTEPYGTVTLREGPVILDSRPVDAEGTATLMASGLAVGEHLLTAELSGNTALPAATSAVVRQLVASQPTQLRVTLPGTAAYGVPVLIQIDGPFEGWYILELDGVETYVQYDSPLGRSLEPGSHTVSAKYAGNWYVPPAESPRVTFHVAKGTPVLQLNDSLALRDTSVKTLAFTVTGSGANRPGGSVQLVEGTTTIGSGVLVNGAVVLNVPLSHGAHDLRAVYSGDTHYGNVARDLTFEVIPDLPFPIEAHAMADGIRIVYVLPPNAITSTLQLHRRAAGTAEWAVVPGWNPVTGMDASVPKRGVTYEYRLLATFKNASRSFSSIDSAQLSNPRRRAVSP